MEAKTHRSPVVVYKVGGSLLDLPDLGRRIGDVLAASDGRPLLVAGGGGAADLVRGWDRVHRLGEERAHRLAVESMRLTAALLADLVPGGRRADSRETARRVWNAGGVPVLSVPNFIQTDEPRAAEDARLPHTWEVTSDSIAAWVALRWPADRLVLLKSVDRAAAAGAVDPYFDRLAPKLGGIGWINLRSETRERMRDEG